MESVSLHENTKKADDVTAEDYDAIYFTGGHGVMFDFQADDLGALTARFYESGRVVAAVCHGPVGLLNVPLSTGEPMINGKNVTGFSWREEELAQRADAVPFSLEDEMRKIGGNYQIADKPFQPLVVTDGNLITGQNPGSARGVAEAVVKLLQSEAV